ncbi:MAG: ATP-grasp domain-containing protein [Bryobacteraceae bacterium]
MSERRRILLVAATTGYQTRMFAEAAERAGVELVLATDRCHVLEDPWGDHALAIKFDDPVLDYAGRLDGIIAVGDKPAFVAARLAANRGLRFHSPDAVAASGNKFLARERFRGAGLLVPEFYRIPVSEHPTGARLYPCVLKPLGLSASRGVIRANNNKEFGAAFRRIRALLEREELNDAIQVERFIAGREFALEGVMDGGTLEAIALFDKPDPLDGPFFEETIYVTPSREAESIQAAIFETAERAVQALGLSDGPIHAEMRVNSGGVWMLEVASRPIGGLCAKAIPGLEEFLLRRAAGEAVPTPMLNGSSGVMMIPIPREGVYVETLGVENAAGVPGITEVIITAKQGHKIVPLPEGASYLGFIFARADTPAEAEQALRSAHRELQFEILGALPVL